MSPAGSLNVDEFRKVLMKTGLVLVVLGHVSFIAAAVLHGTMLRFVATTSDAVVLQYCAVDILSVTSAIVVMAWLGGPARGRGCVPVRAPSIYGITIYKLCRHSNALCLSFVLCKMGVARVCVHSRGSL